MMRQKGKEKLKQGVHLLSGFFRRHAEAMRSAVLAVLICLLIGQSAELWSQVSSSDASDSSARAQIETDSSAAAVPIRFAARNDSGLYGIQYNTEGLRTAYEDTADIWAQALEQADSMTAADVGAYRQSLRGKLLLLDYDGRIPLYAISGWLGCTLPESLRDSTAGTLALCRDEDEQTYTLYLRDRNNGSLRSAQTHVEDTAFSAALAQYEPNGCSLAADETNSGGSPDLMYFPTEVFDVISFDSYDGTQGLSELLTAFGLDAETAEENVYTVGDRAVYVSGENNIRLSPGGALRYEGTGLRIAAGAGENQQIPCIQRGYELTSAVLEAIGSGASAVLTDAYYDSTGRYVTVYGIQLGGIPVDNAVTGYFARCEFAGNVLARADMALRTAQATGETVAVMPEKQAAVSMDSATDAVLSLRYIDEAAGTDGDWNQAYSETNAQTSGSEDSEQTDNQWLDDPDALAQDADDGTSTPTEAAGQTHIGDTLQTSWYDPTGTPVSPKWYVIRYGQEEKTGISGQTLTPEKIVVVQADFDRMIQGGGAS